MEASITEAEYAINNIGAFDFGDFEVESIKRLLKIAKEKTNIPEAPIGYVAVKWEEYKELLIIKGKYEELKKLHEPIILKYGDINDKGTDIQPREIQPREIQTTDPLFIPQYKITC